MKYLLTITLLFFSWTFAYSQQDQLQESDNDQQDSVFEYDNFVVKVVDGDLYVSDNNGKLVYSRFFNDAQIFSEDLDADSTEELIVVDYSEKNDQAYFSLYVYKVDDKFQLKDSVFSGLTEPFIDFNKELNQFLIVAGMPDFDYLNLADSDENYSPIQFYVYQDEEIYDCNDQLYDSFMNANSELLSDLDDSLKNQTPNCETSTNLKALITAIYVNYLSADEDALADRFLDSYYLCPDKTKFKKTIDDIVKGDE